MANISRNLSDAEAWDILYLSILIKLAKERGRPLPLPEEIDGLISQAEHYKQEIKKLMEAYSDHPYAEEICQYYEYELHKLDRMIEFAQIMKVYLWRVAQVRWDD